MIEGTGASQGKQTTKKKVFRRKRNVQDVGRDTTGLFFKKDFLFTIVLDEVSGKEHRIKRCPQGGLQMT